MRHVFEVVEKRLRDLNFMRNLLELLYLLIFAVILSDAFLHTTMFLKRFGDHTQLHIFLKIGLMAVIFAKLSLTDLRDWRRTLLIVLFASCFFAAYYRRSHYEELLTMGLLILGANHVSFQKILKVFAAVTIALTLTAMLAAQMGIIENLIYHQKGRGTRIAFGSVYPTDFSAHIVYLVLAHLCLRERRLTYAELAAFVLLAVFIYSFCEAKTNAGCILMAAAVCFALKIGSNPAGRALRSRFQKLGAILHTGFVVLAKYSMLLLSLTMIALTLLYTESSPLMERLNDFFNTRLSLGRTGFDNYVVGLLGQNIEMTGFGGKVELPDNYFFLDSSYIKMVLCYGLAVSACILLIHLLVGQRAKQRNNLYLLAALGVIGVQCMFEHHILEIAYNPFLLAVLANLDPAPIKRRQSKT